MNNRKTIKIVGPCSKWVEGEGWVTEVPITMILEVLKPSIMNKMFGYYDTDGGINNDAMGKEQD